MSVKFTRRQPTPESLHRLLETAGNFVKYARPGLQARARERALERYRSARDLAVQIGDQEVVRIATLRIQDLERAPAGAEAASVAGDASQPAPAAGLVPVGAVDLRPTDRPRRPPDQSLTGGWPVLHEGRIPAFNPTVWRFRVFGEVERDVTLTYDEVQALGPAKIVSDFHCVTGWSKLDNAWAAVWARDVLALAGPKPSARHLIAHCHGGYTTNLPLDVVLGEGFLAWGHDGADLTPAHGFPLRLVVPSRYAWKSAKWVEGFELLEGDCRGFWETRGYHNRADPWRSERYSFQEEGPDVS